MNIFVTVTKPNGKYHTHVSDGVNVSEYDPEVGAGHDAAIEGLEAHRKKFPNEDIPTISITIAAGAA